jgi:tetratricopeptide (TPR) repeat protein
MTIARTALAFCIAATAVLSAAHAVDSTPPSALPDLTTVRAKIKAKDFNSALTDLNGMIDQGIQHADVYNLLGFSLRKTGDYARALTFYKKALDYDADHKGAHEYLGELYVETEQLPKAREHLAILERLCPQGCEEREDLARAIAAVAPKTN